MLTKRELIEFEKEIATLFDDGRIPYLTHLSGGNEDELIDIFSGVSDGDWVFSTHRSHYHYLLAGGDRDKLKQKILDGDSMFVFDRELNFFSSSILAGTAGLAAGVALALKRSGSKNKVFCFVGDGAEDEGNFYEAARYVESMDLPCTFIVEDNNRSVTATKDQRWGRHIPVEFKCILRYHYDITWPHGGASGGWLTFKCKPVIKDKIKKQSSTLTFDNIPNGKTYIDAVKQSMEELADNGAVFIGYNVLNGAAYGTLKDIPEDQRIETPVAENLMAGLAIGMSLTGIKAVLFLERHDFIYNALDAIVNQAEKINVISSGEFSAPIIIKAVAGGHSPFYAGLTHTDNLGRIFDAMFSFPVYQPRTPNGVLESYRMAMLSDGPVLVSETKDLYEQVS